MRLLEAHIPTRAGDDGERIAAVESRLLRIRVVSLNVACLQPTKETYQYFVEDACGVILAGAMNIPWLAGLREDGQVLN